MLTRYRVADGEDTGAEGDTWAGDEVDGSDGTGRQGRAPGSSRTVRAADKERSRRPIQRSIGAGQVREESNRWCGSRGWRGGAGAAPPSVVRNMVNKTRGIGRRLFVESLTVWAHQVHGLDFVV